MKNCFLTWIKEIWKDHLHLLEIINFEAQMFLLIKSDSKIQIRAFFAPPIFLEKNFNRRQKTNESRFRRRLCCRRRR